MKDFEKINLTEEEWKQIILVILTGDYSLGKKACKKFQKQCDKLSKNKFVFVTEEDGEQYIDTVNMKVRKLKEQIKDANRIIKMAEHEPVFLKWSPATAYLERWKVK